MHPSTHSPVVPDRRRALRILVNSSVALIGGALASLLGAFALKTGGSTSRGRWVRAGTTADLRANVPVARVLAVSRVDGWYRERARQTVFLVWDGANQVHALSATCTHLGCQVRWEADSKKFRCPCHGGVYAADGTVLEGPPPRPLDRIDARVDSVDDAVLVRL
jgi:menaquinol-cytochrome c reductase iron-sulfur subunit